MRKFLFSIILSLFGLLLFHSPIYACGDNSGGIAPVGPKIAGNIQVENYAEISERWCQENPQYANMIIPVTIIYTGSDFKGDINNPEDPAYHTAGNLEAMYANGLFPVIRTWGNMEGEEAIQAGRTLNALSSQLQQEYGVAKPFSVYFGNEPNLESEGFHNDPVRYAASMDNFLQGTGYDPNFPLYMPPIAGHQSTTGLVNEQAFAAQILNATMSDGSKLYQNMDGAFLTIYQPNAQAAITDMKSWWNFYKDLGIDKIAISEIGPFSNNHLLQNPGDIGEWQRIMSEMFTYFKDPENKNLDCNPPAQLLDFNCDGTIDIEFMNTSFFRDLDGDGDPDITDLVIVDEFGNAIVDPNALLIGGGFGWPATPPTLTCPSEDQGPFRPKAYSAACKVQDVPDPVDAKADKFWVRAEITMDIDDAMTNSCGKTYFPQVDWEASIGIDPSKTYYPQAGFGESYTTDNPEAEYLADYIDGSIYGDKNPAILPQDWDKAGIFRKISTGWYQDEKKCELIKEAIENYDITLNLPDTMLGSIAQFIYNLTPLEAINQLTGLEVGLNHQKLKSFTCPPSGVNTSWVDYLNWKVLHPRDAYLWAAVPNFTRQDTPGDIVTSTKNPPSQLSTNDKGSENDGADTIISAISVPHAQRTNDASQEMVKLMAPAGLENIDAKKTSGFGSLSQNTKQETPITQNKIATLVSNFKNKFISTLSLAKNKIIAFAQSKNLLAQADPVPINMPSGGGCNNVPGLKLFQNVEADGTVTFSFSETLLNGCYLRDVTVTIQYYVDGQPSNSCQPFYNVITNNDATEPTCTDPNNQNKPASCYPIQAACKPTDPETGQPVLASSGKEVTASVSWSGGIAGTPGGDKSICGNTSGDASSCSCSSTGGSGVQCEEPPPPPPPPPPPCGYNFNDTKVTIKGELDDKEPDELNNVRSDKNPVIIQVDSPDAGPIYGLSHNNATKIKEACELCEAGERSCSDEEKAAGCREVKKDCSSACEVTLQYGTLIELEAHFPYNKTIFENFAKERETGFLNYFIPAGTGEGFEKDDNYSKIGYTLYSFTAEKGVDKQEIAIIGGESGTDVEGKIESGLYLFGAQKAKQCVSQRLFVPSFAGQSVECPDLL